MLWKSFFVSYLARHSVRTELSKSERRRDLPEQRDDIHVLDPSLGVGVVLAPQPHKLVKMVGSEDGPITGQVVEVVHDDGDEQVEDEEGAHHEEGDEVGVGEVRAAAGRVAGVFGTLVTDNLRKGYGYL